jgi:CubicO group peptidase (beta-lactamase class C family)
MYIKYAISILILIALSCSCIPIRSFFLGAPDKKDAERFPSNTIQAENDCFQFKIANPKTELRVNNWTNDRPSFENLNTLCANHAVRAFLVIQRDSLIFNYRNTHNINQKHLSYSIAKSLVSCLIGIAIDKGAIPSENSSVIKWLPELSRAQFSDNLRIRHLLNHTSGIKPSIATDARLYYGKNIESEIEKITFECAPGIKQKYLNINTELLGILLSRATGKSLSQFTQQYLWEPIEMCEDAQWSTDKQGLEKAFCCISATAKDYAKFGRLYLNKGKWNGKTVFSEDWYNKSIRRDSTEGSSLNFNYSWHIGLQKYQDFMAIGLYKQHIYIYPEKEVIIVLLNNREDKLIAERVNWWNIFRQIADQL